MQIGKLQTTIEKKQGSHKLKDEKDGGNILFVAGERSSAVLMRTRKSSLWQAVHTEAIHQLMFTAIFMEWSTVLCSRLPLLNFSITWC